MPVGWIRITHRVLYTAPDSGRLVQPGGEKPVGNRGQELMAEIDHIKALNVYFKA